MEPRNDTFSRTLETRKGDREGLMNEIIPF